MSNYDKSILDQQHILDSREPEPIEWVYMVVADRVELLSSSTDFEDMQRQYINSLDWNAEYEEYEIIELCKVDKEQFSQSDFETTYRQSETIEHATLNLTDNE